MKKYVNGQYVEMTAEEAAQLAADVPVEENARSLEQRLETLEAVQQKLLAKLQSFLTL